MKTKVMENRRYKANLQGLLKFCTENTKYEDAPSHFEPMSEEVQYLLFFFYFGFVLLL